MTQPCILVVESDDDMACRIGAWLADAGYTDVMTCPGPQAPDYTCLAGLGTTCPLSKAADVVVLDLDLASDQALEGTPSWQLLLYYVEQGCDVVALSQGEVLVRWLQDDRLATIPRPREPEALLGAVDRFVSRRGRRPA